MRALAMMLCAMPCLAQEQRVPERMTPDGWAAALACTLEKAILGKKCTFEGDPGPADAAANLQLASRAAARACEAAAKSGEMRKACLDDAAQIAKSPACTLGGKSRLA